MLVLGPHPPEMVIQLVRGAAWALACPELPGVAKVHGRNLVKGSCP